jgi:oligopeptidase B
MPMKGSPEGTIKRNKLPLAVLVVAVLAAAWVFAIKDKGSMSDTSHDAAALAPLPKQTDLPAPPLAKQIPFEHTYHGEKSVDPYHWLRDSSYPKVDDPEILDYLKAENSYVEQAMGKESEGLRARLFEELKARVKEDDTGVPYREGDYIYQTRFATGQNYPIYVRRKLDAPESTMAAYLDVNELAKGKSFYSVASLDVSPNGRYLAYVYDDTGAENFSLVVKDLESGALVGEPVTGVSDHVGWAADNSTLFYVLRDESQRPKKVMRHRLDESHAKDALVYDEKDPSWWVGLQTSLSGRWIIIGTGTLVASETLLLPADRPETEPKVVIPRRDNHLYQVIDQGDDLYICTNDKHQNFRVVKTPINDWSEKSWTEVMAGSDRTYLTELLALKNWLVIAGRQDGIQHIWVSDGKQAPTPISLPDPVFTVSVQDVASFHQVDTLRIRYASLVTPQTIFDYDIKSKSLKPLKVQEIPSGYDPNLYVSERLMATARDGTMIPVSIVYKKGFKKDGKAPLHLYGYGSYSIPVEPNFSTARLTLLNRGFAYAIAHIRGGSELGRAWHDGGRLKNKPNTFNDFIDVAQFLIGQGYTAPGHISIEGGSAGGTLMGAALNQASDGLFAAAVAHVPFVDVINTLFDATLPLTTGDYPEWGNPNDLEIYKVMKTYSPYDNLARRPYPPLLVTAGLNDYRVTYWEPAKWVAKLRTTKTDANLLLLQTEMSAGHSGSAGRFDRLKETALSQAFILRAHGISQ